MTAIQMSDALNLSLRQRQCVFRTRDGCECIHELKNTSPLPCLLTLDIGNTATQQTASEHLHDSYHGPAQSTFHVEKLKHNRQKNNYIATYNYMKTQQKKTSTWNTETSYTQGPTICSCCGTTSLTELGCKIVNASHLTSWSRWLQLLFRNVPNVNKGCLFLVRFFGFYIYIYMTHDYID